jgi:hypothetical protein
VSFYFPFPDYKFAKTIVSGELSPEAASGLSEFIVPGSDTRSPDELFDQRLAWREALGNGLLGSLANSFLVLAPRGRASARSADLNSWDAVALSTGRRRCYWTQTEVHGLGGGSPVVNRTRLHPQLPFVAPLRQHEYTHPWLAGSSVAMEAIALMQDHHCRMSDVADVLQPWRDFLTAAATGGTLPGELLDATPGNGIAHGRVYEFFDREFTWDDDLALSTVVLRGLFYVLLPAVRRPGALRRYPGASVMSLIRRLSRELGLDRPSLAGLRDFFALEARLQATTTGLPRWRIYRGLARGLLTRVPVRGGLGRRPHLTGRLHRWTRALRALSPW